MNYSNFGPDPQVISMSDGNTLVITHYKYTNSGQEKFFTGIFDPAGNFIQKVEWNLGADRSEVLFVERTSPAVGDFRRIRITDDGAVDITHQEKVSLTQEEYALVYNDALQLIYKGLSARYHDEDLSEWRSMLRIKEPVVGIEMI